MMFSFNLQFQCVIITKFATWSLTLKNYRSIRRTSVLLIDLSSDYSDGFLIYLYQHFFYHYVFDSIYRSIIFMVFSSVFAGDEV